jgi:cobalt/nickel transport system permease protein
MKGTTKLLVLAGLIVALGLALFVSPFASRSPDGLDKVAADSGLDRAAEEHDLSDSPVAGYRVSGVDDDRVSTGVAGVVGVLVTFGVGLGVFALVRTRRPSPAAEAPARTP